ncbi:hypothetical protein J5N97_011314 [Dioscorea zingiberensis]|uniref:Uncharacterized protein n=1 Tax=Dioscorea zingiberensis TaxID=325984 RepID=A0A9D5HNE3_9LILI|nr:hypothetical protein J5N97_011314 [Dioscorea zingiberensis]
MAQLDCKEEIIVDLFAGIGYFVLPFLVKIDGGMLHIHGNVIDSEESSWLEYVVKTITNIAKSEGLCWQISVEHLERVKWYGPHIRHLVADLSCKKL